jgi:hypothetical protein
MSEMKIGVPRKKTAKKSSLPFTRQNYIIFFIGLATILIGYICLSTPPVYGTISLTVAPILLGLGYLVLIPISILYRKKENSSSTNA